MHNGYQIDPLSMLHDQLRDQSRTLLDLSRAAGRIEQRLSDGAEFHREVKEHMADHKERLIVLETKWEAGTKSAARKAFDLVRLLWPFLALTLALTKMVLSMAGKSALAAELEWFLSYMPGFRTEG